MPNDFYSLRSTHVLEFILMQQENADPIDETAVSVRRTVLTLNVYVTLNWQQRFSELLKAIFSALFQLKLRQSRGWSCFWFGQKIDQYKLPYDDIPSFYAKLFSDKQALYSKAWLHAIIQFPQLFEFAPPAHKKNFQTSLQVIAKCPAMIAHCHPSLIKKKDFIKKALETNSKIVYYSQEARSQISDTLKINNPFISSPKNFPTGASEELQALIKHHGKDWQALAKKSQKDSIYLQSTEINSPCDVQVFKDGKIVPRALRFPIE